VRQQTTELCKQEGRSQPVHDAGTEAGGGSIKSRTYRTKSDGSSSQSYQAPVPRMRLVDGIGKVVTKLIEDGLDPGIVLLGDKVADEALEPVPGVSELDGPKGSQAGYATRVRHAVMTNDGDGIETDGDQEKGDPLESANLALIVQLVVQGTLNGGIHDFGPLESVSGLTGHAL